MDLAKTKAVQSWPTPRTLCALRSFLGLTGYYRHFINNYGLIAAPLTAHLKWDALYWTGAATAAFDALKSALTSGSMLQLPDFTAQFLIDCDASGSGFGAVLHQSAGTWSSPALSGPRSFSCPASRCTSAPPSTPKLTVSRRSPTVFSASTFAASPTIDRGASCSGCHGPSFATTRPSRC
jgi:hypothetical protein